jgi:hypothetical protein
MKKSLFEVVFLYTFVVVVGLNIGKTNTVIYHPK